MTGQFLRLRNLPPNGTELNLIGLDLFIAEQHAPITFTISGTLTATGCTISGSGTGIQQAIGEGSMFVNYLTLDGPPTPLDRMVVGSGTTTLAGVTETITCAGGVETVTLDIATQWLSLPAEGVPISADGQTISGTWVRTDADGTKTSAWSFKSVPD
jgi:phage baseplate assembly protein gpV